MLPTRTAVPALGGLPSPRVPALRRPGFRNVSAHAHTLACKEAAHDRSRPNKHKLNVYAYPSVNHLERRKWWLAYD
eukprot:scaffold64773_cov25-Tisochrysis_lutea.AAC.4